MKTNPKMKFLLVFFYYCLTVYFRKAWNSAESCILSTASIFPGKNLDGILVGIQNGELLTMAIFMKRFFKTSGHRVQILLEFGFIATDGHHPSLMLMDLLLVLMINFLNISMIFYSDWNRPI